MSIITKTVGERLRARRLKLGWSQEYTAEMANLHPTYIGQLERGEKNATIESIEKICLAMHYPMDELFQHLIPDEYEENTASLCYQLIALQSSKDQKQLYEILKEIIAYKN